jgi:uncharacterized protein YbjT (DUF2867 family)
VNAIVFGATGLVGQGVLRECLRAPDVEHVLIIGRTASGVRHPKLREIVRQDLWNYADLEPELSGFGACFFCLGASSAGMKPEQYEHITYDLTVAAAETLVRLNPSMTFIYVSGAGTDSSESGKSMWARVRGKTENALLRMPFKAAYMFRLSIMRPLHGARSKTRSYQVFYSLAKPLLPLLHKLFPNYVFTTEEIGQAMLTLARSAYPKHVLETRDIRAVLNQSIAR